MVSSGGEREGSSDHWRADLVTRFGAVLFVGGALLLVRVVTLTRLPPTALGTCLLVLGAAAAALRRGLDFRARGLVLVGSLLALGAVLARQAGPGPGTVLALALATVLAAVVFGGRVGALALAVSTAGLLLFGSAGRLETAQRWAAVLPSAETWVRMTAAYALMTGLLVLLVASAVRRVEASLEEARASLGNALRERRARAEAEAALSENEERLRLALEAARMGTWEWDICDDVLTWSRDMWTLFGMPTGDLTSTFERFRGTIHPEDREAVERDIGEALASGRTEYDIEYRLGGIGPVRWVEGKGRIYRDEAGRPVLMRGTAADITGRKRSDEALRESEAELRRRETLAAIGSLVAAVAHEVRTPLFSLSATIDTLEAKTGTTAQRQELRALLRSQVRRLSNLMQDLLDYGRAPRLRLVSERLGTVLRGAVQSCQPLALQGGVRVAMEVPDHLPDVPSDAGRLQQAFENLVANALEHAPRGSTVKVSVVALPGPPSGVACRVEDEGPGVSPEDLPRVFEPFFSRRKGGTGMGLAVAQRFVEAHGGSVAAANRGEGGAVFTVFLPTGRQGITEATPT